MRFHPPQQSWNGNPALPPDASTHCGPALLAASLPSGYLDGCLASSRPVGRQVVRGDSVKLGGGSIAGHHPTVSDLGLDPTQLDRETECVCLCVWGAVFQTKSHRLWRQDLLALYFVDLCFPNDFFTVLCEVFCLHFVCSDSLFSSDVFFYSELLLLLDLFWNNLSVRTGSDSAIQKLSNNTYFQFNLCHFLVRSLNEISMLADCWRYISVCANASW